MRGKHGRFSSQRKDPMTDAVHVVNVARAPWPTKSGESRKQFSRPGYSLPIATVLLLILILFFSVACGYHTAGHGVTLPADVQTIAIPAFVNQTQTYKIEQKLTAAVVREMVTARVTLTDRQGKVLYENPSYLFREEYEVSRELSSFFEEDSPALQRLSREFARTLVSSVLEGF